MNSGNRYLKLLFKLKNNLNGANKELSNLSNEQLDFINLYLYKNSYLEACPGGGKTEVIGIKTAWEISKWKKTNSGIAVLTFTNSAAKELNIRVRKFTDEAASLFPHFIGTFDSWIQNYIFQPFSHYLTHYEGKDGNKSIRIVESENTAPFLANYATIIWINNKPVSISVTDYSCDKSFSFINCQNKLQETALQKSTEADRQILIRNKALFLKAGFATYPDVETICLALLSEFQVLTEKLTLRFPVIFVDECQDLSLGQIELLDLLRDKGTSLHFVGDLNQSIYEFRKVDPDDTLRYITSKSFINKRLTNNYRSCQPIVDVCRKIIASQIAIKGFHPQECITPCILWEYNNQNFSNLPVRFERHLRANNISVKNAVILSRGNSLLKTFRTQQDKYYYGKMECIALALSNWYNPNRNAEELYTALFYAGRFLCLLGYSGNGSPRNQYCPDTIDAVEWRVLLRNLLESASSLFPFENRGADLTWSQWIAIVKAYFLPVWSNFSKIQTQWDDVKAKFRAPAGMANIKVSEICTNKIVVNPFRATTIHGIKGETLEAVMLISSRDAKSPGGHFSHWMKEGDFDPEHIRFAYVACSRPRSVLIVATPALSAENKSKLENWGLTFQQ